MKKITLTAAQISKVYNGKSIFKGVSFEITQNTSFAITGKNGAGKSTLIKILCRVLSQTKGTIQLHVDQEVIEEQNYFKHIGLVSPYLNLYEEFSAEENLQFIKNVRGLRNATVEKCNHLLERFGIYEHRKKEVKNYSSGMKQRLKYCAALLHDPLILVLDEPSSNLDEFGIAAVHETMKQQKSNGILIFGTNDKDDLQFADSMCNLDELEIGK